MIRRSSWGKQISGAGRPSMERICANSAEMTRVRLRRAGRVPSICNAADNDGREDTMSSNWRNKSTTVGGMPRGNLLETTRI